MLLYPERAGGGACDAGVCDVIFEFREKRLSNATCLTQAFFKSGE